MSSLRDERNHLRRNMLIGYVIILVVYGALMLILIVEENKKVSKGNKLLEMADDSCVLGLGFSISR